MSNALSSRQRPDANPPANPRNYFEAAIAGALAADTAWFAHNPGRAYRIRRASQAEVKLIQAVERRLIEQTPGCEAVVVIHRVDETRRRRVVIEAYGVDCEALCDDEVATLFENVVGTGRTSIARGRA